MQNYIKTHAPKYITLPDTKAYHNTAVYNSIFGWKDYYVMNRFIFSHRINDFNSDNFRAHEPFNIHTYYELLFPIQGKIRFFCENQVMEFRDNIFEFISPFHLHASRLLNDSSYERFVFYFPKDIFSEIDPNNLLLEKFMSGETVFFHYNSDYNSLLMLLNETEKQLQSDHPLANIIAYSNMIKIIGLLNHHAVPISKSKPSIPPNVQALKSYIDENFLSIENTSQIAKHFFYSREHISRLFSKHYNTKITDYIAKKKIDHSIRLIKNGTSICNACYQSGFQNLNSFTKAFKETIGVLPSKYQKSFYLKDDPPSKEKK